MKTKIKGHPSEVRRDMYLTLSVHDGEAIVFGWHGHDFYECRAFIKDDVMEKKHRKAEQNIRMALFAVAEKVGVAPVDYTEVDHIVYAYQNEIAEKQGTKIVL